MALRIAFVTPEFCANGKLHPGGLASYLFNMALALKEQGHEPIIILLGSHKKKCTFHTIEVWEFPNYSWRLRLLIRRLCFNQLNAFTDRFFGALATRLFLNTTLSNSHFDIIHYTNWKGISAFSPKHQAVLRISSYEPLWDNFPDNRTLDKRLCCWLERHAIKKVQHIIGPGRYLAQIIEQDLQLSAPITILPTPLPITHHVDAHTDSFFSETKLIVYAGTISYIKGADLLFNIIEELLSRNHDITFMCIGKPGKIGPKHASERIASMQKKFPETFIYMQHLDRKDLLAQMSMATIVLIPSLVDNFPNTALEALTSGAFVIASQTASLDAVIQQDKNGFIMKSRDVEDWVEKIRTTLDTASKESRKQSQQISHALLKNHKPANAAKELIAYYKSVLKTT